MVAAVGDAFWLAGYEIIKLDRQGSILFRQPVNGWWCASVSVNPKSGGVWLVERNHPDVPNSKNRVWLLKPDGSVSQQVEFGEQNVFGIDCDPVTGDAWICAHRGDLRKVSPAGKVSELKELGENRGRPAKDRPLRPAARALPLERRVEIRLARRVLTVGWVEPARGPPAWLPTRVAGSERSNDERRTQPTGTGCHATWSDPATQRRQQTAACRHRTDQSSLVCSRAVRVSSFGATAAEDRRYRLDPSR